MRVKRERVRRLEKTYLKYRERVKEVVSDVRERYKAIRKRIHNIADNIRDRFSDIAHRINKDRIERAKKEKLEGKATVSYISRDEAITDKTINDRYSDVLDLVINNIKILSQSGMLYIPENFTLFDQTKAIASYYFAPYIPSHDHFTMYAVKLTPLTIKQLANELADFYVNYELEMKDYTSPYSHVADYYMQLFEMLLNLMRRKSKRERVRNKSKGHYGRISYNEPIHDMITVDFTPYSTSKLICCILNSYWLKRWKAMSIGRPELANKMLHSSILAIIRRKGKYTKKYPDLVKKVEVEERHKLHSYHRIYS